MPIVFFLFFFLFVCVGGAQIIFEDDEIIAVSKPPGMVVHPAPGSWNGTFVNALVFYLEKAAEGSVGEAGFQLQVDVPDGEHNRGMRPGIVHRLDKGTTGVLLAAKNPTMQANLAELFAKREVRTSAHCQTFFVSKNVFSSSGLNMLLVLLLLVLLLSFGLKGTGDGRSSYCTSRYNLMH